MRVRHIFAALVATLFVFTVGCQPSGKPAGAANTADLPPLPAIVQPEARPSGPSILDRAFHATCDGGHKAVNWTCDISHKAYSTCRDEFKKI